MNHQRLSLALVTLTLCACSTSDEPSKPLLIILDEPDQQGPGVPTDDMGPGVPDMARADMAPPDMGQEPGPLTVQLGAASNQLEPGQTVRLGAVVKPDEAAPFSYTWRIVRGGGRLSDPNPADGRTEYTALSGLTMTQQVELRLDVADRLGRQASATGFLSVVVDSGGQWTSDGKIGDDNVSDMALSVSADGRPLLLYKKNGDSKHYALQRTATNGWRAAVSPTVERGLGISNMTRASLGTTSAGQPFIASCVGSSGSSLKSNTGEFGINWAHLGGFTEDRSSCGFVDLAIHPTTDVMSVAYSASLPDDPFTRRVHVTTSTDEGETWIEQRPVNGEDDRRLVSQTVRAPQLRFIDSDTMWLAYSVNVKAAETDPDSYQIVSALIKNNAWTFIESPPVSAEIKDYASFKASVSPDGVPHLAYALKSGGFSVWRLVNEGWERAARATETRQLDNLQLMFHPSTGHPVVIYRADNRSTSIPHRIMGARLEGESWLATGNDLISDKPNALVAVAAGDSLWLVVDSALSNSQLPVYRLRLP